MKLKLIEKNQETNDVFSFIFQPPNPVSWQAGQYVFYKLPHDNPDDRGDTRIFTIASPPYQERIMITTRFFFQESSSFKKALFSKEVGDFIEALRIQGHFTVEEPNKKLVFIAGGIGITPFHSILLELENRNKIKDIILIYSNRNEESVIFKETLDRLEKKFQEISIKYIYSPQRCDKGLIKESVPDIYERIFYLSGPIRMVRSVEEALEELNVNRENIRKDYFPRTGEK
jgi:glycine betaine catabolism B